MTKLLDILEGKQIRREEVKTFIPDGHEHEFRIYAANNGYVIVKDSAEIVVCSSFVNGGEETRMPWLACVLCVEDVDACGDRLLFSYGSKSPRGDFKDGMREYSPEHVKKELERLGYL